MTQNTLLIFVLQLILVTGQAQQHTFAAELEPLNFLVGEWSIEVNARLSKTGPWEKSEARSIFKKAVGETIFEEEFTGTRQGKAFIAKTWLANDNRTRLYQRVFVDSEHGVLILFEGKLDKNILTLEKEMIINNAPLRIRVQYHITSENTFTVENSRSVDGGKTWDRTGFSIYSRLK